MSQLNGRNFLYIFDKKKDFQISVNDWNTFSTIILTS